MTCPFCTMPESKRLHVEPLAFAVLDLNPASRGHSLIVPHRHVTTLFATTPDEQMALLRTLAKARAALDLELKPDGYNIGINDGVAAGQTVDHLHIHLIPRFRGDVAEPRGGVRHVIPTKGYYPPST
jgi:diadenosine tetraphosphate (Ap4A) HIT family hydrolase